MGDEWTIGRADCATGTGSVAVPFSDCLQGKLYSSTSTQIAAWSEPACWGFFSSS